MIDKKEQCPHCSSALTITIGNQRHCNSCGHDFDIRKNPVADAAAQRNMEGFRGWRRPETNKT